MRLVRALVFSLICWSVLLLLDGLAANGPVAYRHVLVWLAGNSAFLTVSIAFGGAVTNQKGLVIALLLFVCLGVFPADLPHLARALAPIGLGILAGVGVRGLLEESGATELADGE
jgi:hypothetical protein